MNKTESLLESLMFKSRWLLAPFFFGMIVAIVALLIKFGKQLVGIVKLLAQWPGVTKKESQQIMKRIG